MTRSPAFNGDHLLVDVDDRAVLHAKHVPQSTHRPTWFRVTHDGGVVYSKNKNL